MNIGFVSYWFERGAAYVTRQYAELLKKKHKVFVYARGGIYAKGNPNWDLDYVTWGMRGKEQSDIVWHDFKKWIKDKKPDVIFFNEQRQIDSLIKIKKEYPNIILGAYIDYYRMDTVKGFSIYDFLICNTKRHYSVFNWHEHCFYIPWGTYIDLFKYEPDEYDGPIRFFHSAGMSDRKGLKNVISVYMESELHNESKLIVHTQSELQVKLNYTFEELKENGVTVINKTVTAPGLYHMGDVYVYPTTLDGLGLSIYEALSSGLPVIGTNVAPVNEVIDENNGRLVKVDCYKSREDGYYWPLSYVDDNSLYENMKYYVNNRARLGEFRKAARKSAEKKFNWYDRSEEINSIFEKASAKKLPKEVLNSYKSDKSVGDRIDEFIAFIKLNFLIKGDH